MINPHMNKPRNLLFIYTDEQRADTLGAYGNRKIQTPHLDRLAAQSCVFEKTYITQPVCTPSRSSLLTGLYPHTSGCTENNIPLPEDTPCLPEMIENTTYSTGHHGKWHLGDELFPQHGFEDWISVEDNYQKYFSPGRDREARSTYHHFLLDKGYTPKNGKTFSRTESARFPEEVSKPALLATEASRFIRENRENPFVLFVNFFEPHMPFFGPRDDQYDPADIDLPANFSHFPGEKNPFKTRVFQQAYRRMGNKGLPLESEDDWRRIMANYWGLCSLVDTHAGTILKTIEDCGLWDDTIIVYTSDHGDMMGSHHLLAKCVMFEEAMRVPLLLHLPGQTEALRVPGPVSQIDLVPTLLDLMDEAVPDALEGCSWKEALLNGEPPPESDVVVTWNGANNGIGGDKIGDINFPEELLDLGPLDKIEASIRDPIRSIISPDGWKLCVSSQGEHELYQLNDDPFEQNNLAFETEYRGLMEERLARIREWQKRTEDKVNLSL